MKRKILGTILLIALASSLTACGGSSSGSSKIDQNKNDSTTESEATEGQNQSENELATDKDDSDANYSISTQVRLEGEGEDAWCESVDAKVGDRVEFRINYQNTATKVDDQSNRQANVMIRDILPSNLKYVEGTTKLYNVSHPSGATLTPDGDLVTRGVNIGNYRGGSNAIVTFTAEVTDTDLSCGANTLTNWGQGIVNDVFLENSAFVNVNK